MRMPARNAFMILGGLREHIDRLMLMMDHDSYSVRRMRELLDELECTLKQQRDVIEVPDSTLPFHQQK